MQDPEAFEADGGWSFLDMEGDSGEEEEESEEGDPEFQADGDDSEELEPAVKTSGQHQSLPELSDVHDIANLIPKNHALLPTCCSDLSEHKCKGQGCSR